MKKIIIAKCIICKKTYYVKVNLTAYTHWQAGQLIQNAMPDMPDHDREFLITQICPTCQDEIFNIPEPE